MELDGRIDGEDDENMADGEAGRVVEEMVRTTHPHSLLFLYIHIYIYIYIPREDELEDCPLCGELYLEDHFIYDCVAMHDIRVRWLDVGGRGIGGLRGLVWQRCSRLGTFLRAVRERLVVLGDS